jgi:hypothetical protein
MPILFIKRTVLFFSLMLALSISMRAQTVKVKKESARVANEYADGFEVLLEEGTYQEVEASLNKLMKTFGKTKTAGNLVTVREPVIQEKQYNTPVYGVTKQLGTMVSAWVGLNKDDWSKNDLEVLNKDLEKIVQDFGVNFYREKIQKQIDESVRASQAVERQKQRLTNQSRDLNTKINDNKREKIQLEKSLENNKTELETLTRQLEKNKKDQDSIAVAGDQIKKVIEMHKLRQQKVN